MLWVRYKRMLVQAIVENHEDIKRAVEMGADGIGKM
jgi:hypothetical protein